MITELQLRVAPEIAYEELRLMGYVSTKLHIDANSIKKLQIIKRSIDARQRNVVINLSIRVYINELPESDLLVSPIKYQKVIGKKQVIVVGAGPAGLCDSQGAGAEGHHHARRSEGILQDGQGPWSGYLGAVRRSGPRLRQSRAESRSD